MDSLDNLPSDVVLRAQVCCKRTTFVRWLLGKDVGATWQPRMQRSLSLGKLVEVRRGQTQ